MSEQNVEEGTVADSSPAPASQDQVSGVITVVLTADNHLGYVAPGLSPRKRAERQQRLRHAFQQATDFAIGQGVDLFLQAGDLFDSTNPDEQDRSFVATRLQQLRQAGVRTFAVGGLHDTPTPGADGKTAPQSSYARLGALHYFTAPAKQSPVILEPEIFTIHGTLVGIAGIGVVPGQQGDPLAQLRVDSEIERAAISLLLLHAPIEGNVVNGPVLEQRAQVSQVSLERQVAFRYILAGYHHGFRRMQTGKTDVIVAGATQHIDLNDPTENPGFVFLGLAADGIRWCRHIGVDAVPYERLIVSTEDLWPADAGTTNDPTATILARLQPLRGAETMVELRLVGEITRVQYHQLDMQRVRLEGEEHFYSLSIDDTALLFASEQKASGSESGERISPREELVGLADEWIASADDEQERRALVMTKEELLAALDGVRYPVSVDGSLR
jgi:DNA repair exonuclease SbcCD nuclease subunit